MTKKKINWHIKRDGIIIRSFHSFSAATAFAAASRLTGNRVKVQRAHDDVSCIVESMGVNKDG